MMAISPGCSRLVRFLVRRSSRATPPISGEGARRRSRVGSLISCPILPCGTGQRRVPSGPPRACGGRAGHPGGMSLLRTIPALPVADLGLALAGWTSRLGYSAAHVGAGLAVLRRDDAEVHLWEADDVGWARRADLADRPVRSGAESFLAGT